MEALPNNNSLIRIGLAVAGVAGVQVKLVVMVV